MWAYNLASSLVRRLLDLLENLLCFLQVGDTGLVPDILRKFTQKRKNESFGNGLHFQGSQGWRDTQYMSIPHGQPWAPCASKPGRTAWGGADPSREAGERKRGHSHPTGLKDRRSHQRNLGWTQEHTRKGRVNLRICQTRSRDRRASTLVTKLWEDGNRKGQSWNAPVSACDWPTQTLTQNFSFD